MSKADTYNYEEIQRYLQHKMDAKEMHAFERAMMDDPFLADAIEGYRKSNEAVVATHLTEIERQLTINKEQAKVVSLPLHKTTWWKVAAIVLIIVSGGAISYFLFNNPGTDKNTNLQIAQTEPKEIPVEKDSIGPADNTLWSQKALPNKELQASRKTATPFIRREPEVLPPTVQTRQAEKDSTIAAMEEHEEKAMLSASAEAHIQKDEASGEARKLMRVSLTTQNEFKGSVTDTSGKPVPFATIVANNNRTPISTDASGSFTLKAPDSVLQVDVSSVGFAKAKAKIKSDEIDNRIILKEDRSALNEVVVIGYGTKRKKNLTGSVTKVENKEQSAGQPEGGWKNFDDYVKREIKSFKDSTGTAYNKTVTLEFSIDQGGHPKDIQIKEEADQAVADKAIQILKNGPGWKGNKNQSKVKVSMAF